MSGSAPRRRLWRLSGLLLAAAILAATLWTGCRGSKRWNVLLITFDTTRADHLGCYGHLQARTPTLDRLAEQGVLFEQAFTAVPITAPSHSTILTGTYPLFHGVRDNALFTLPEERTTLAELLQSQGYATGAAVASFPLLGRFKLSQGFDFYDDHVTEEYEDFRGVRVVSKRKLYFDQRPAGRVNDALLAWLRQRWNQRFFAWIHYFDPHQPLTPPPPYNQLFARNLYLGEIAYADESLGRLLGEIESAGVLDHTLVVMTADHGEGHGEHNEATHALLCYNATLHVPLIMKIPGHRGGLRIQQRVGTVDILPTILELLGLEIPSPVQGRSLVPLLESKAERWAPRLDYAETLAPRLMHGWGELRAVFQGPLKYVYGPRPELYDLEQDPDELHNLIAERPAQAQELEASLRKFVRRYAGETAAAHQEVDAETLRKFAALGYLSSQGERPAAGPEELRAGGQPPQDRVGDISLMSETKELLGQRRFLEARDGAQKLLDREPLNPFYLGLLAAAYVGLDQRDQALAALERAPQPVALMEDTYFAVAADAFRSGAREQGLELARRTVAAHESAYGYYLLASMYEVTADPAARLEALHECLRIEPDHAPARLNLAIDLAESGRLAQAEREIRRVLDRHPLFAAAHFNYAKLLGETGKPEPALRHLERALELNPRYWEAYLARLAVELDLGRHEQAQQTFLILRNRCPDPEIRRQAAEFLQAS
ncbi:MAG TPA: sulfatase-like hydrolase/transferase [Acidobacteriota bacterium]